MRNSDLYNVSVPELGDRADITVVSDAILQCEKNQSGKIEYMEASNDANTICLISKTRNMNLKKYYYGMSMQFISPINMGKTTSYTIKVDNLDIQPFNFDIDIKKGDIVSVYYGDGGFSTSSYPIHNDSAKKSTKIIAGNGLTGGGDISGDRTINIVSENDGIIVQPDYIKLNVYNDVNGTSGTRAASANAVKRAYDKALEASNDLINKLDKGTYSGNAEELKEDIDEKMSKYQPVDDIMDYDDLIEDGFYIVRGTVHGVINSPHWDISLVQVWSYIDAVYQKAVSYYDVESQFVRCIVKKKKNTKWEKIINTTDIMNNLTTTAPGQVLDARQGKKLFDEKLDKGTYSGNAGDLKADIDNKVSKSGDTMTGTLKISSPTYPEVVFNNIEIAAVGYSVSGEFAYLRAKEGNGLRIYDNSTATLQANNLNTNNKEVVAAINELNSRSFVKIGECLIVNQSVSIYGYNEFVVCEQNSKNTILDIKYFTKDIVNSLKSLEFVSHGANLECKWVFSADGSTITLKDLGYASDGGIYVYGR